jgi:transposase
MNNFAGIDISKAWFDAELNGKINRFDNDLKSIKKFSKNLPINTLCFMESTGNYCYQLANQLIEDGHVVYIVNPLSVKCFARMKLMKTKSDRIDAKLLTEYGKINKDDLKPYQFASEDMQSARQAETVIEQLTKQKTAWINQIEALRQLPNPDKEIISTVQGLIKILEQNIKKLEEKITKHVKEEQPEMLAQITSIKGIGNKTACFLIALTNAFSSFDNAKQLASYLGCCPRIIQSGSSVRPKNRLCKMGLAGARTRLYLCALSAIRCNIACKNLYDRLIAKGKAPKSALLAVANKLIHQIFGIISKNEFFDNNFYSKKILFGI